MSGYSARCPSCGAPLVFQLGASLLRVCDQCGAAVARKGADLASYGRVAELIPTPSVLALGARGGYAGAPFFELIGRLQLDYGAGTWDEWLMGFADGAFAWLSEVARIATPQRVRNRKRITSPKVANARSMSWPSSDRPPPCYGTRTGPRGRFRSIQFLPEQSPCSWSSAWLIWGCSSI